MLRRLWHDLVKGHHYHGIAADLLPPGESGAWRLQVRMCCKCGQVEARLFGPGDAIAPADSELDELRKMAGIKPAGREAPAFKAWRWLRKDQRDAWDQMR